MPQERVNATTEENTAGTDTSAAVPWQRTLWAMVGIQFVMTAAFSMLSPIMPLFLPVLGVSSAVDGFRRTRTFVKAAGR